MAAGRSTTPSLHGRERKEGELASCARYRIHKRSLSLSPSRAQEKLGMEKEGGRKDDRAAEPRFSGAKVVIKAFSLARARREKEGTLRQR